jgi:hypothetical protein
MSFDQNYTGRNLITVDEVRTQFIQSRETTDPRRLDLLDKKRKAYEEKIFKTVIDPTEQKLTSDLYNLNSSNVNVKNVNNLIKNDFYEYNTEEGIHLMSKQLLSGKNLLETSKKVHEAVRNFKTLAAGAYGQVFLVSIAGNEKESIRVIVKTSKDIEHDDLRHELLVSFLALNKLREYIPNFSFAYGGFKCNPPVVDEYKNVLDFCGADGSNVITYALQENIPGDVISKAMLNLTAGQFVNYYLQVLLSLNLANQKYEYSHFDLHSNNCILRNPFEGEGFNLRYPTSNGDIYLVSDKIATIIDYGMSGITYKNVFLGSYNLSEFKGSNPFPLFDAFKFLLFCMLDARDNNNFPVLEAGAVIAQFFSNDSLDSLIDLHVIEPLTYYELPNFTDLVNLGLEPLIYHIINNIDCSNILSKTPNPNYRNLQCMDYCLTLEDVKAELRK